VVPLFCIYRTLSRMVFFVEVGEVGGFCLQSRG
jgi:hypothetical protein